ncbi:MAG: SCO family protein [Bacteroidota bacterium]|jgi:protein SCO1/2
MNIKGNYYWFLILIPLVFVGWFFKNKVDQKPLRTLPYFGKKKYDVNSSDSSNHSIKSFRFKNQYNQFTTNQFIDGKIYVADFFFTTCQSICPIMSNQLERVYKAFYNDPNFLILSHTVDPEFDSVPVLLNYAKQHGVNNKQWMFLTGSKKDLYEMARTSYLLNNDIGNGDENDFIHTQNFALVDYQRHLRGFYDGTDSAEVSRLIIDIKLLLDEYTYKNKK